jgi:hypothetical protein
MAREIRANREFGSRTTDTARWAREQIKRQTGMLHIAEIPDFEHSSRYPWHDMDGRDRGLYMSY